MTTCTDVQANLPLREATFFIVLSLTQEPKHGYAIMKEVQVLSEGRVLLSTGTLYGAIKRLLNQGWIRRVNESGTTPSNRERKEYALTDLGRRILKAEVERLNSLVTTAQLRAVREQA
ncbi:MAG: helix-turn-helix transcriptional regulator [Anaerolineae bacterium]|nr:helix-turn-helix transcriptional regulator [Anaerolineae bacterium]